MPSLTNILKKKLKHERTFAEIAHRIPSGRHDDTAAGGGRVQHGGRRHDLLPPLLVLPDVGLPSHHHAHAHQLCVSLLQARQSGSEGHDGHNDVAGSLRPLPADLGRPPEDFVH